MSIPSAHEFDDELLSAYLDNEVTAAERAIVEQRLRTDERARQVLDDLRAASEAVKSLPRPRLGRDLTAAVLNEIERQDPAVDAAHILTMPVRESAASAGGSSGSRGLIWASLAVAAALMLMVLRTEQPAPRGRDVARSPEKRFEGLDGESEAAAIQSDEGSGERDLDRGGGMLADKSKVGDPGSNTRQGFAQSDDERFRETTDPGAGGTTPLPPGAAAPADADAAEEPTSAAATAMETIRVEVAADDIAAAFQNALASAGVELEDDEFPTELAADVTAALAGDETETTEAALAYVVEASPAQIDAVAAALRLSEQPTTRAADATAESAADPSAGSRRGRAWRAPADRAQAAQSGEEAAVADAAPAAGPTGFGGGVGAKRVLFLLRSAP